MDMHACVVKRDWVLLRAFEPSCTRPNRFDSIRPVANDATHSHTHTHTHTSQPYILPDTHTRARTHRSLFGLGALLAYTVGSSAILPGLWDGVDDPLVRGATDALGGLFVLFFAGVGGALAPLNKELALGLAFGFSALATLVLLVGGTAFSRTLVGELALVAVAVVVTALGYKFARKYQQAATVVATALMGSLLVVCAIDKGWGLGGAEGQLIADLTAVMTFHWDGIGRCGPDGASSCHGWVVFIAWLAAAVASVVVQGWEVLGIRQRFDAYCVRCDGNPYASVAEARTDKKTDGPVRVQRAHSRGDSTGFRMGPRATNFINLRIAEGAAGQEEAESEGSPRRTPEETALITQLANMYEVLTSVFGFQEDNAYNQVEHLVILLGNQKRYQEPAYKRLAAPGGVAEQLAEAALSPAEILHQKLFQNYKKWTQHLKVAPHFDTNPDAHGPAPRPMAGAVPLQAWHETDAGKQKLHDCLLWMLIWGEAGNLRHMPECLAWLYHKVRVREVVDGLD
jgi:hypothetical protein